VKHSHGVEIAGGDINPASGRGLLLPWIWQGIGVVVKIASGIIESDLV
jgi:hypothetical protein